MRPAGDPDRPEIPMKGARHRPAADPLWYKDAVIYELHVKSFHDSDGDGIGDFRGLTRKLDYLESLGVTAIWLLPFYPSPLRDDGYDIADYYRVNPQYGTLADFKDFLREAHARGLRVITELVLNHTSDQHEWFKKSRAAKPGSPWRDFYVWSDTTEKYKDARVIFNDFERSNWTWDPEAKAYFWHRFYSHQPDLNFDNPAVVKATLEVMDYWFEMGVDGMRLDAIPYLFEREGTNCENLPETYRYLEKLRAHVDRKFSDRLLLAEANQWPEDAVAYFGKGNRCHMAFHFPVMPRLFMASWMEDRFPIVDIFDQTPKIPNSCQWAIFLRNHDELTLEMVSDEERDYMYRMYAKDPAMRINMGIRRRLAPLMNNNRAKIELLNILLLSLPGTPVIYYGDEICMGDNHYLGDRNGVRTPMQWSADRNAGFSRANPQKLFLPVIIDPDYHYEAVNVESFERNRSSMLWWMRRVIAMRRRFLAFSRGTVDFLDSDNPKVLAFVRSYRQEHVLVVVNLSRFSQVVTIDLSRFAGYRPEEVVSGNRFPEIRDEPYTLTLGFHDYFWLSLAKPARAVAARRTEDAPSLHVAGSWQSVLRGKARETLEKEVLPGYVRSQRWFGGKARSVQQVRIAETVPLPGTGGGAELALLDVRYSHGPNDSYLLPLAWASGEEMERLRDAPAALIARLEAGEVPGALCDGMYDPAVRRSLLMMIGRKRTIKGTHGSLAAFAGRAMKGRKPAGLPLDDSHVIRAEQSNTSVIYGRELFLKLFRRLEEGVNPDLEVGRFLSETAGYPNTPAFCGGIEYRRRGSEPLVLAILQKHAANEGDAWTFSVNAVRNHLEKVLALRRELGEPPPAPVVRPGAGDPEIPERVHELMGEVYLEMAAKLGRRTAELHAALATPSTDPAFRPEPFTLLYQRSLYHALRGSARRTFELLRKAAKGLDEPVRREAEAVLRLENAVIGRFTPLYKKKIETLKIRIHGDYHLGQVLYTGDDFQIIDFEGEPAIAVGERRLKRSPLRDVAGMIRSFQYPPYAVLYTTRTFSAQDVQYLEPWGNYWSACMAGIFLREYLASSAGKPYLPSNPRDLALLLDAFVLSKAVYEVGYELNNRPAWLPIPLRGIRKAVPSSR